MSITDADDLDMNLSEPEDDGTSLTNHADLEAALADDSDDILASIDDDPLDLSLGGDTDASELEAEFSSETAIGDADETTHEPAAADVPSVEEKADSWEDAPENLTGNFTDLAQAMDLGLSEEKPEAEEAPVLTSAVESPLDLADDEPADSDVAERDFSSQEEPTEAPAPSADQPAEPNPMLKRIIAGIALLVLGGGSALAILLMGANSRIAELEQRVSTQVTPQATAPSADLSHLEQRISTLQTQLDQIALQPAQPSDQASADLGQFNDKIGQLQAAFEQLSQTIQEMQRNNIRTAATPSTPAPKVRSTTGSWHVNVMSFAREDNARKMQQELALKGLDTEITTSNVGGKTWYRLGIAGQASRADALALRDQLQSEMGLENVWIGRN